MTGWKLVEGSKLSQWKALDLNSRCNVNDFQADQDSTGRDSTRAAEQIPWGFNNDGSLGLVRAQ